MSGFQFFNLPAILRGGAPGGTADDRACDDAAISLRCASELVEHTAFACAGRHPAAVISQLIIVSADLERLAQVIENHEDGQGKV